MKAVTSVPTLIWSRLPEGLKSRLRGNRTSARAYWIDGPKDWISLTAHKALGGTYLTWYSKRLDNSTGRSGTEVAKSRYLMNTGGADLQVCKELGLKPEHRVYEFGTGQGRTSQHFIRYLEPGHFSGNDASQGRIAEMENLLSHLGLMERRPNLFVNKTNDFTWLPAGYKCDFFWCESVLCHMPNGDVEETLFHLRKIMKPTSIALINDTHLITGSKTERNTVVRIGIKDWFRPVSWYTDAATKAGYTAEDISATLNYEAEGAYADGVDVGAGLKSRSHLIRLSLREH